MKKYVWLLILLFIASLNFNLILKPLKLVTGGTQGVAILINHIFNISPSLVILIINLFVLVLSYFLLPRKTTYGSIMATFIYPLFIKLTSCIKVVEINDNYTFLLVLLTSVICGVTGGFVYKLGFSSGGINLIGVFIKKYFSIKIYITNFIINTIIILLSSFYFDLERLIYAIIVVVINSILINLILKNRKIIV